MNRLEKAMQEKGISETEVDILCLFSGQYSAQDKAIIFPSKSVAQRAQRALRNGICIIFGLQKRSEYLESYLKNDYPTIPPPDKLEIGDRELFQELHFRHMIGREDYSGGGIPAVEDMNRVGSGMKIHGAEYDRLFPSLVGKFSQTSAQAYNQSGKRFNNIFRGLDCKVEDIRSISKVQL